MYNPHANMKHMHHIACHFSSGPDHWDRWEIANHTHETVAAVATSTTNHATEIIITLILGRHKLPLDPITRPGGMRTALRWVCQELNNGHLWLGTRLALEREARLLGYTEPELLACGHAHDYQYCLRLLTSLPGLAENWPRERSKEIK